MFKFISCICRFTNKTVNNLFDFEYNILIKSLESIVSENSVDRKTLPI